MNITETDNIIAPLNVFYKRSNGIKRICLNEDANGCPANFQLVRVYHIKILECRTSALLVLTTKLSSTVLSTSPFSFPSTLM